jgi:hypothetical protein
LVALGISADCESRPIRTCSRHGVADGLEELTALVPEIEQIPQEVRF